jgi:pyroglutamyl-peptidase
MKTAPTSVLVTGFEPFGGDVSNPSGEIALALDGRVIAGRTVRGAVLSCRFGHSLRELRQLLRKTRPELVVCLGLAGNRVEITPERVAINVDDARIRDNAGRQPVDRPVVRGAPVAYWSTLPVKAIVSALQRRGVPASVSQTAGTFVCNHVFFGLMHALRREKKVRGGFTHVPPIDAAPGLSLAQMTEAIAEAIRVSLTRRRDLRSASGTVS